MTNVRCFKLTDKTELLAELCDVIGDSAVIIKRPLVVVPMRSPSGEIQIGFAVWSMLIDQDQMIRLPAASLICEPLEVTEDVARTYIEQVTGIALPSVSGGQLLQG